MGRVMDTEKSHVIFWRRKRAEDTGAFIVGKVRKHRFEGDNPGKCARCGASFSSAVHK